MIGENLRKTLLEPSIESLIERKRKELIKDRKYKNKSLDDFNNELEKYEEELNRRKEVIIKYILEGNYEITFNKTQDSR